MLPTTLLMELPEAVVKERVCLAQQPVLDVDFTAVRGRGMAQLVPVVFPAGSHNLLLIQPSGHP